MRSEPGSAIEVAASTKTEIATALPEHDKFGPLRRMFSVLSITAATALLTATLVRLSVGLGGFDWWLPLAAIAGAAAADFLSGLIHWSADTWGSETMPVIGRRLLHPFRVHHVNPDDFLRRTFIDTNGDVAFLVVPILLVALAIPLNGTSGRVTVVFLVSFCAIGFMTNQVHQWAHMPKPPVIVKTLQGWGVILGRHAHQQHHRPPYADNYCIATGWLNRPLTAIAFFRRLEWLVTRTTGLMPREDDAVFRGKSERQGMSNSDA